MSFEKDMQKYRLKAAKPRARSIGKRKGDRFHNPGYFDWVVIGEGLALLIAGLMFLGCTWRMM